MHERNRGSAHNTGRWSPLRHPIGDLTSGSLGENALLVIDEPNRQILVVTGGYGT